MSIPVSLSDLGATLRDRPWGYFVTVGASGRAHTLAVPTDWRDGALHLAVGRTTAVNVAARPDVTMVFPPADGTGYSLIVDGAAALTDDGAGVTLSPEHAVLHRPAIDQPGSRSSSPNASRNPS